VDGGDVVGFVSCNKSVEFPHNRDWSVRTTKHNTSVPRYKSRKECSDTYIRPDLLQHFDWVAERRGRDTQATKEPVYERVSDIL
jgi:hypothetical protein